ncbi:FAD-binding oxidoreductase [Sedimentisphaera salicampi]|uniref:FAD-binding oxidoreductase n=1 Tax=Sedimentisphaera salicampi TaxID=1941349 RepID=UPI000B9BD159|nr:FAD-linked oxidase C-terminal domain-containing protein [Sedimentisphaera salicampi]OXU15560.1 putative FAD-linked oxidoreductase [Sedimentisphaera salicampi]
MNKDLVNRLKSLVGENNIIEGNREGLEPFSHDEIPDTSHVSFPEVVVKPSSKEEIVEIVKLANKEKIPITPRGAGSGLSGGAVPVKGGIVISFEKMNSIIELDLDNLMLTVEPGVVTNDINEYLNEHQLFFPGYPMSEQACFIGGNIAENAGGAAAVKYGVTRRYVLGLEVVTPTGNIVNLGGKLNKDVTGYDLIGLFIGSEGTLGIVTKIILKLLPKPKFQVDLLCIFDNSEEAVGIVPEILKNAEVTPKALEFMDQISTKTACNFLSEKLPYQDSSVMLIVTFDGDDEDYIFHQYQKTGDLCQKLGAKEIFVSDSSFHSSRIWNIRKTIGEAFNSISSMQSNEDLVVPPASIPRLVEEIHKIADEFGIMIPCFGHAGDGNIHARVVAQPDFSQQYWEKILPEILNKIYRVTGELGGKISGEHGIGSKRKGYMKKTVQPEYIDLLRLIKKAWDPNDIMNPGKIFD